MARAQQWIIAKPEGTPQSKRREAAAREVLLAFGDLSPGRVLCFFDEDDWGVFKDELQGFGQANRAVSGPVRKPSDLLNWPLDLVGRVFPSESLNNNERAFDFVIYLHNSTCHDPTGLTMTFAHELQHFTQWATLPVVWKANERFKRWCLEFDTGLENHELPIEKDARIVAKRIATRIHGSEAVDRYIKRNLTQPVNDLDRRNWQFISGIDVANPYDVEIDTASFDQELKRRPLSRRCHVG